MPVIAFACSTDDRFSMGWPRTDLLLSPNQAATDVLQFVIVPSRRTDIAPSSADSTIEESSDFFRIAFEIPSRIALRGAPSNALEL